MIFRSSSVFAVAMLTAAVGCDQGDPVATVCRDIPANGCPLTGDGTECEDTCCAAAYACVDGDWSLDHTCTSFKAGQCPDGAAPVVPEAGESCNAAGFDAPPGASGGPGCIDLQAPDCPASQVLVCSANPVDPCNGCQSLFVCESNGWVPWGVCNDDGGVVQSY